MLDHWMIAFKSELIKANLPTLDLEDNSPLEEHVLSPRFDEDKVAEQLSTVVIEEKTNFNTSDVTNSDEAMKMCEMSAKNQTSVLLSTGDSIQIKVPNTNVNGAGTIPNNLEAKVTCDVTAINNPPVHTLPDENHPKTIVDANTVESPLTEAVFVQLVPAEISKKITEDIVILTDNPVDPSQEPANPTNLLVYPVQEVNPSDVPLSDTDDEEDEFHESKSEEVILIHPKAVVYKYTFMYIVKRSNHSKPGQDSAFGCLLFAFNHLKIGLVTKCSSSL
jgi:hypothetical protein